MCAGPVDLLVERRQAGGRSSLGLGRLRRSSSSVFVYFAPSRSLDAVAHSAITVK